MIQHNNCSVVDWTLTGLITGLQAANLPFMFSLDTLMKMGSLPSLRLPESGFPSLIAQRPFNGEAGNMQAFSAASEIFQLALESKPCKSNAWKTAQSDCINKHKRGMLGF